MIEDLNQHELFRLIIIMQSTKFIKLLLCSYAHKIFALTVPHCSSYIGTLGTLIITLLAVAGMSYFSEFYAGVSVPLSLCTRAAACRPEVKYFPDRVWWLDTVRAARKQANPRIH